MAKVNVLNEILKWSLDRPPWQRDALRRLVTKAELDETDIGELSNLCKSRHGLGDREKPVPLNANHLPQSDARKKPVSLESLTHHVGVNALAQNQTIDFGPCLTVVYGANAAGKSGYTRILKRVCRARGAEEILGNVMSGTTPGRPGATIKFTADEKSCDHLWTDDQPPNALLSRVSVFDHHCASVYVTQRTDVAFRPMGLDLFDKLSDACEAVKKSLEKERSALESQKFQFPDVAEGTAVHELITNLTSLTNPASVHELASLTEAEKARNEEVRKRIRDLQSDDPEKTARAIEFRAKRAKVLVARAKISVEVLSDISIKELFAARDRKNETQLVAKKLHRETFQKQPLQNTGSDVWRTLWGAAEQFSIADAYPDRGFPFTGENSRCVLCQQELTNEGILRLRRFQDFLSSTVQGEHDQAAARYREKYTQIKDALVLDELATESLDELQLDDRDIAGEVRACLDAAETRRAIVNEALTKGSVRPQNLPAQPLDVLHILTSYIENLGDRAKELREANQPEIIRKLKVDLSELEARQLLADHLSEVLEAIERKKKIAAYQLCIDETRTNSITHKSSNVTRHAVTEPLTRSFAEELKALRFHHVEVQMVDAGGSRGALYHKLQLRRAPGIEVGKVVSEGEARCLSIASFFAELSTAADRSAILFDDPVSSLDHHWRGSVAKRLVVESQSRQVIVFTHDIVFLLALKEKAQELDIDLKDQYLRRDSNRSGLSSQQLPWAAMKVKNRIGHLNHLYQAADKTYRNGNQEKYEQEASDIYGLLREAWERGVEEVLLGEIVVRYRNSVQTQRARQLADICDADCKALDIGMKKCSKWLLGHDQSPAENAPFPEPNELKEDIDALNNWVQGIRKRRSN